MSSASRARLAIALPVLAALLCFGRAVGFELLHLGDAAAIGGNPVLTGTRPTTLADWLWLPGLGAPSPVTVATHAVEHALGGAPGLYHLTNLVLHLASVGLLVWLALRLRLSPLCAGIAGGLLALHPVVAEPVCWVSARPQLIAAAASLASLHLWWSRRPALAIAAALLGLGAHPSGILLPIAFLALDRYRARSAAPLRRGEWAVVGASAALGLAALGILGRLGEREVELGGPGARLADATILLGVRAGRLLWPATLSTLPAPPTGAGEVPAAVLGLVVGLVAIALLVAGLRRPSAAWVGLAVAALFYFPVSGLVAVERLWHDAHLYLPLAGLALAAGAAFHGAPRAAAALTLPVLLLAVGASAHAGAFASSDALIGASRSASPAAASP